MADRRPTGASDAEPLLRPRLDDNGLATYSMVVPADEEEPADATLLEARRLEGV